MDEKLLTLLVCPETKKPLRQATPAAIEALNKLIGEKKVRNRGGSIVETPVEGLLIREDNSVLYPIIDSIPIMLVEESFSGELLIEVQANGSTGLN